MDAGNIEEKEVYKVNNQKYTVITRQSKNKNIIVTTSTTQCQRFKKKKKF